MTFKIGHLAICRKEVCNTLFIMEIKALTAFDTMQEMRTRCAAQSQNKIVAHKQVSGATCQT